MSQDPLAAAKALELDLHTQVLREEARLRRMHTAGHDHFQQAINQALPSMTDEDLDGYNREAGALGFRTATHSGQILTVNFGFHSLFMPRSISSFGSG